MIELLPCPFCGNEALIMADIFPPLEAETFWVECFKCNACTDVAFDFKKAITFWNQRA